MSNEMDTKAPIVIAHRGFSSEYPENTVTSFDASVSAGFSYIELDIHLTADSVIVVMHDETVNRTTNGEGKIRDLYLKEIKSLDAGSWFDSNSPSEKVPTLKEILTKFENRVHIFVEIKSEEEDLLIELRSLLETMGWIPDNNYEKSGEALTVPGISIISFLQDQLLLSAKMLPELAHGLLTIETSEELIEWCVSEGMVGIFPYVGYIDKNFVSSAHNSGLYVGAWGFENPEQLSSNLGLGLDGVTVDWPVEAAVIIGKEISLDE
ncbi:hypothetical protein FIM09_05665 [SAR202 cluster bacterium AC-647-P02_OGT_505m]|nr:hypothetical protein [SAR202 cluster bacterium AC-647-P02_OGT_505m]